MRRKYNPNSARPPIFDGVAEARLIVLTFSPAPEGFARWSLRWHYTPKHGSWLDMAEAELGVLASQCLDRNAWQDHRNKHHAKANCNSKLPTPASS